MPDLSPPSSIIVKNSRVIAFRHVIAAIQRAQMSLTDGPVWTSFLQRLPLTLGEAEADRLVAYSFSDSVHQKCVDAVEGLVDLLKRRADPGYDQEKKAALLPDDRLRVTLWPKRFCPRTLPLDSQLRPVVHQALRSSSEIDGGLLESWLSRTGGGLAFIESLKKILSRSWAYALEQPNFSGVTLMAHLAALNCLLEAKKVIKNVQIKNLNYTRLERAVGFVLHAGFTCCVQQAIPSGQAVFSSGPEYLDRLIILSNLGPNPFQSIRQAITSEDINPYGVSNTAYELLTPLYQQALEHNNDPQQLLNEIFSSVVRQKHILYSLAIEATCEYFRTLVLNYLEFDEDPTQDADRFLAQAFYKNSELRALLENSKIIQELFMGFKQRWEQSYKMDDLPLAARGLLNYLEGLQQTGPPWASITAEGYTILQDLLERFLLLRLDEFAQAHLEQVRRRLVDRRSSSPAAARIKEYEAGKLYRISDDDLPLVKARIFAEEAQLFVDLKGYTRRTARSKELVMAEFLKEQFYEPILQAARKYCAGTALLPEEENIRLVNLLGDAVAFSGNVVALVNLARDIQQIFEDYRKKLEELAPLDRENSFEVVRRELEQRREEIFNGIETLQKKLLTVKQEISRRSSLGTSEKAKLLQKELKDQSERIKIQIQSLQAQMSSVTVPVQKAALESVLERLRNTYEQRNLRQDEIFAHLKKISGENLTRKIDDLVTRELYKNARELESQIAALEEENWSLEETLEEERRMLLGSGLEAGLYIAFGSVAERIEIQDEVWGTQKVAVSERINESARGTARNMTIKYHLDDLIATERIKRGNPKLEFPFRVYISETRSFSLEPSSSRLWNKALAQEDRELLNRFIAALESRIQQMFEQSKSRGTNSSQAFNDIYNLGEALSIAALDAYIRQTRHTHFFFRIQIRPTELNPQIQERFFFPDEMLTLIIGKPLSSNIQSVEWFRYVGQVIFRGFEASHPTPVYELLRATSPIVQLLTQHHLDAWLQEAMQNQDCRIEGLLHKTESSKMPI